jgi:RimJ/RimL family protein N-acetyltransferase
MFPDLTCDDVFRIETKRLWLRWPNAADAAAIARFAGDKRVAAMTAAIPHPYPLGEAAAYVARMRQENAGGGNLTLVMASKDDPAGLIGVIGLRAQPDGRLSLGFWVGPPAWGQGFATEAAQALIDTVYILTPVVEIVASARIINAASRGVLEKCGFQFSGQGMSESLASGVVAVDLFRLPRRTFASLKLWRTPSVPRLAIDLRSMPIRRDEAVVPAA